MTAVTIVVDHGGVALFCAGRRGLTIRTPPQAFDDIGNRTSAKFGGDAAGANLRSASYTPTPTNTYSSRTVPGGFDVLGLANSAASVTVNSSPADYRRGEYFQEAVSVSNGSTPVWQQVNVTAVNGGSALYDVGES